jgi:hypothetical protein
MTILGAGHSGRTEAVQRRFLSSFRIEQSLLEAICAERSGQAVKKNLEGLAEGTDSLTKFNAIYASRGLFSLHDPFFTAMLIKAAYRPDGAQLRDTAARRKGRDIAPAAKDRPAGHRRRRVSIPIPWT